MIKWGKNGTGNVGDPVDQSILDGLEAVNTATNTNTTKLAEIKKYALDNKVPIMQDEGIDYLINYIKDNKIESILEVGTAIVNIELFFMLSIIFFTLLS